MRARALRTCPRARLLRLGVGACNLPAGEFREEAGDNALRRVALALRCIHLRRGARARRGRRRRDVRRREQAERHERRSGEEVHYLGTYYCTQNEYSA